MIQTLFAQVRQYRRASLLAPLFTGLEVLMEVLIPFVTASIIDKGIEAGDLGQVYRYGILMLFMAFFEPLLRHTGRPLRRQCIVGLCLQSARCHVPERTDFFFFQH